jgi:hypothetical protein
VFDGQLAVAPGFLQSENYRKNCWLFFGFMSSVRARKKIIKNHCFIPRNDIGIFILIAKLFKTNVASSLFSVTLLTSPIDNFSASEHIMMLFFSTTVHSNDQQSYKNPSDWPLFQAKNFWKVSMEFPRPNFRKVLLHH